MKMIVEDVNLTGEDNRKLIARFLEQERPGMGPRLFEVSLN